ncbi:MAG: motility protein A [Clostridia bacterium]|nr:motility protein A [Clostridia bacterium]
MDIATIFGLVAGVGIMLYGILSGGALGNFIDPASVAITVGGGLASTIICFPLANSIQAVKILPLAFRSHKNKMVVTIRQLVELSQKARRDGLLALESAQNEIQDSFLKKALELVVDGIEAEMVRNSMQLEIDSMAIRHQSGQAYYRTLATQFPAWGMIGTLMGLVNLLKSLDDPSGIGPAMALAIITTFYGSVLANFLCTPIANKLAGNSADEIRLRELMVEGILSIQSGENPRLMEHKLKTFLSPEQKLQYDTLVKHEQDKLGMASGL